MTSAAREPMLRPDAVLSAAAPPARVDVSRPLDPLRGSDLSYHMMLFLCFARFIRLLFLFRRPVPALFVSNPPATVLGCQKSVLTGAVNRCYALPSLLRDDAPRLRARSTAALQHAAAGLPVVDHSDARDAVRCDATQASQNTPVAPPTCKNRSKPSSRRNPPSKMPPSFKNTLALLAATASAIITPRQGLEKLMQYPLRLEDFDAPKRSSEFR